MNTAQDTQNTKVNVDIGNDGKSRLDAAAKILDCTPTRAARFFILHGIEAVEAGTMKLKPAEIVEIGGEKKCAT
jgi:hypothetical protein